MIKKVLFMGVFIIMTCMTGCFDLKKSDQDIQAIRQTTLDYIEGWYEGNAERMARALHPQMVKRMIEYPDSKTSILRELDYPTMVNYTRSGGGADVAKDKYKIEIKILDIQGNIASVMTKSEYIDYLHLAKFNNKWVIINVLWDINRK